MSGLNAATQKAAKQGAEYSAFIQGQESRRRQAAKEFSRALHRANKVAVRKPELAADWCRYAATLAWTVNPGFFYCHEMEQLLAEIGHRHLGDVPPPTPSKNSPRRFLHVMSGAYETGGHTRVVARWIDTCAQHAPSELHSILVSMQKDDPLPTWLRQSAQKTGGELIVFPPGMSWLQMAAEIRLRSFEFDVVVLHIHPNDPLPNMAFYDQPMPVLLFRHADHVFNLGIDVARVVADFRPVGREMSRHFCAAAPRKVLLPLPILDQGYVAGGKADARKKLGLPADALIALTIGEPYKFTPMYGYSFPARVQSLCAGNPRVIVVAVGPSESDLFPEFVRSLGCRFKAVGVVSDPDLLELYYRAANVYMDAYPVGSMTAVLDAARHGLPAQRLYNPYQCLMWDEDHGLDSVCSGVSTEDEYFARVHEWLEWPEEKRLELGGRLRDAVLRDHCGAGWKSKWLDRAIDALANSREPNIEPELGQSNSRKIGFPGLGDIVLDGNAYTGMMIAGIINADDSIPRPIRISGALHSIKPALFHTGNGTARKRLLILRALVSSCVPIRIRIPVRNLRKAVFKNFRHEGESTH